MRNISCIILSLMFVVQIASSENLVEANNPLAGVTAVNTHNYLMSNLTGTDDTMNSFMVRIAQPFLKGQLLVRATIPINSYISSIPDLGKTGMGTANFFGTYSFINKSKAIVGAGPFILFPGTNGMGTESLQLGAALVAFFLPTPIFQGGSLVTWQMNVGGPEDTHVATFQPFLFFQLGKGTYLRSSGIMTFDIENSLYNIPIGFGLGHAFKGATEGVVYNIFVEPQFSIYSKGNELPSTQFFFGFNMQFAND